MHEVAYNRWYERDHFYSGCMIGPWQFAGKRFVATADLKALRDPDSSAITGEPGRGSYVSVYWVLDGHHDDWNLWAVDQVRALHKAGRMFEERDHVHTLLYRHHFDVGRDEDPVPAELALDHPYKGLVATWIEAPATEPVETARTDLERRLREDYLPAVLAGSEAGLVVVWEPLPLQVDVPGVARSESLDRRLLLLWFLDAEPQDCFDATAGKLRRLVEDAGHGTVIASLPFIPTVPGTDKYTDQLWAESMNVLDDMQARAEARGWVMARTLWGLIEKRASATPDAVMAVNENGKSMTFSEYRELCLSVAAGLRQDYGIGEGSSVSWPLPTWLESFVLVGALSRLSARQNPIIPIYREREVGFAVNQTDADLLVVPSVWRGFDYEAMARSIVSEHPVTRLLVSDMELPEGDVDAAGALPAPPASVSDDRMPRCGGSSTPRARPQTRRARSTPT